MGCRIRGNTASLGVNSLTNVRAGQNEGSRRVSKSSFEDGVILKEETRLPSLLIFRHLKDSGEKLGREVERAPMINWETSASVVSLLSREMKTVQSFLPADNIRLFREVAFNGTWGFSPSKTGEHGTRLDDVNTGERDCGLSVPGQDLVRFTFFLLFEALFRLCFCFLLSVNLELPAIETSKLFDGKGTSADGSLLHELILVPSNTGLGSPPDKTSLISLNNGKPRTGGLHAEDKEEVVLSRIRFGGLLQEAMDNRGLAVALCVVRVDAKRILLPKLEMWSIRWAWLV